MSLKTKAIRLVIREVFQPKDRRIHQGLQIYQDRRKNGWRFKLAFYPNFYRDQKKFVVALFTKIKDIIDPNKNQMHGHWHMKHETESHLICKCQQGETSYHNDLYILFIEGSLEDE